MKIKRFFLAKIVAISIILGMIFSGMLSSDYEIAGFTIFELYLIILFLLLSIISYVKHKKIQYGKIDKLFIILYLFILILPILRNFGVISTYVGDIVVILLPIKIYLVYRILYELYIINGDYHSEKLIVDYILFFSFLAGLFGLFRFMEIPILTELVNQIWPIDQGRGTDPIQYGRLVSTMSGTNGGASFFGMVSVLAFFQYLNTKNYRYLYFYSFNLLIVLLSGSLTSILITMTISIYLFVKFMNVKSLTVISVLFLILSLGAISMGSVNNLITTVIENRIEGKLLEDRETVAPRNLVTRYERWDEHFLSGLDQPLFGHGVNHKNSETPKISLTHNYYMYLFIYTGICGLIAYIFFYYKIFKKLYRHNKTNPFIYVMIYLLVAQLTQLTNHYGGISELLGIMLYINRYKI